MNMLQAIPTGHTEQNSENVKELGEKTNSNSWPRGLQREI